MQPLQPIALLTLSLLSRGLVSSSVFLTTRAIFLRMKNYTIYAVSITIGIVALTWRFDFPTFMVLLIATLDDGTIMIISKDIVKPSPLPNSWKLGLEMWIFNIR